MRSVFFLSLMNSDAWGGSEEIWFRSALQLAQKGSRVGVCCFNWPGKENKLSQLKTAGCELHLLPGRNETRSLLGKLKLNAVVQKLPIESYDEVIINQGGWKDIVHGPFKNIYTRCKSYSVTYHNYDNEKLSPGKTKLFREWVTGARANIGDASRIFSVIAEVNVMTIPKQYVLFNPITITAPAGYTPFSGDSSDELHFIMLAQLDIKRKAQDILIKTLSDEKWKTRNWKLSLYGKGQDEVLLQQMIEASGLKEKIFLKGYTQNIAEVISRSHILLQLTHIDAMPIAVTEAMAMSRPVIASNVGDMPLWINDGVNGWISNEVTPGAIDVVVEKAWQNRHRLEAMGRSSFDIFTKKYPPDPISYFLNIAGITTNET